MAAKAITQLGGSLVIYKAAVHRSRLFIRNYLCLYICIENAFKNTVLLTSDESSRKLLYTDEPRKAELSFNHCFIVEVATARERKGD